MPGLAERALLIIRERYADFGPTLACEKLAELHGLYLAKETVRELMIQAGLWIPRKLRPPRVHQPRPRHACIGELIQIDVSEHRWFEERGPACTLLVFAVSNATIFARYGGCATHCPGTRPRDVFRADNCSDSDVSSAARHGNGSSGRRFGSACQPACAPPQSPGFGSTPGVFHCTT